jgi:hypothetical protein
MEERGEAVNFTAARKYAFHFRATKCLLGIYVLNGRCFG